MSSCCYRSFFYLFGFPGLWIEYVYVSLTAVFVWSICEFMMRSLLKSTTIVIACLFVRDGVTSDGGEFKKRDNITLKAPIIATPSQHWYSMVQDGSKLIAS